VGAIYRHFRNGMTYKILVVGTATGQGLERTVVYEGQYKGPECNPSNIWVRPLASFMEEAESGVRRFQLFKAANGKEVEVKFVVPLADSSDIKPRDNLKLLSTTHIEQIYLDRDAPAVALLAKVLCHGHTPKEVRIRRAQAVGSTEAATDTLTFKSDGTLTRDEVELELETPEVFEELTTRHAVSQIKKTRTVYQLPSGLLLECDVFAEPRHDFMMIEVEFEPTVWSREQVTAEIQAAFPCTKLRDVTEDKSFKNAALAVKLAPSPPSSATTAARQSWTAETVGSPTAGGV
jgi:CYTH domain-containing protein